MNCREVRYYLNDYADGMLPDEMRGQIAEHLIICKDCKEKFDNLRSILEESNSLPKSRDPKKDFFEGIISRIAGEKITGSRKIEGLPLQPDESAREYKSRYNLKFKKRNSNRILVAGGLLVVFLVSIIISFLYYTKSDTAYWMVQRISGTPLIGTDKIEGGGMLKPGDWLITDDKSKAGVKVGTIGEMEVDPKTRLRLLEIKDERYKIQLDRGTIHSEIWAPPKLFYVQTPSTEVVDLGCTFYLKVSDRGSSFLKVSSGWVALKNNNNKTIIPAGAVCETRLGIGPGTPYFADAPRKFVNALERFDFETKSDSTLSIILNESREKDALSLLNLMMKTNPKQRNQIFHRLQELVQIPDGITYEGIMKENKKMFEQWWEALGYGSKSLFNYLN